MKFKKGQIIQIIPAFYEEYAGINGKEWADDMNSGIIVQDIPYPSCITVYCPNQESIHDVTARYFEVRHQKTLNELVLNEKTS